MYFNTFICLFDKNSYISVLFIVKKNSNVVLISSKWESGVNYESAEV